MQSDNTPANTLVLDNLGLVGYYANEQYARLPDHARLTRADLVSAGSLALVKASRAFDPDSGVPFVIYASTRIKGAMLDELRSVDWVSRQSRQRARHHATVRDHLTAALHRDPTVQEVAEAMGVDLDRARADAAVAESREPTSIDSDAEPLADLIRDDAPGPEETILNSEMVHYLHTAVACLPERLCTVVTEVFLNDRPVADVAEDLGVTVSRVSQMRAEALSLLREALAQHLEPEQAATAPTKPGAAERRRQAYYASVASRAALVSAGAALRVASEATRQQAARPALMRAA